MDNQVLYAEARGDRGGIGMTQYGGIQNTAANSRQVITSGEVKLQTATARQIANLRAQGEFEKADKVLEISNKYLTELQNLEKWAKEKNVGVQEFNLFANDPTYRERVSKGVLAAYEKDPSLKKRLREISKELWQDPVFREKCSSARRATSEDPQLADRQSLSRIQFYEKHPGRKEKIRRQMQEYLSKPENRKFVDCCSRPKPVICVETGEVYPSQHTAEKGTGYAGIHKACSGLQNTSGGYHWRFLND